MASDKSITTKYDPQSVEDICDAFGKGFDQCKRDLKNPYPEGGDQWHAYRYGREPGKEEHDKY
jgi:hypothetical protein